MDRSKTQTWNRSACRFAIDDPEPDKKFACAECGKKGVLQGDIKKHYHYIHPNREVRIVNLTTGEEFSFNGSAPIPVKARKSQTAATQVMPAA